MKTEKKMYAFCWFLEKHRYIILTTCIRAHLVSFLKCSYTYVIEAMPIVHSFVIVCKIFYLYEHCLEQKVNNNIQFLSHCMVYLSIFIALAN